ncbi:MAG: efflux RND transporter periplasmic adaptor subunit [candidate division Zixibacteria bacterium]|nr:efflux RND transporter periplasmic adaptor subunit [candidate division Zixibacteria bacterium]
MVKKISIITVILIVVVGAVFLFARDGSAKKDDGPKTVAVAKGSIVDKALAVGRIDPKRQISVKSKLAGIIKKTHVEIGDRVKVGDPLFTIAPDPTPLEFAEAKRQVELAQVTFDNQKLQMDRKSSLKDKQLISNQEWEVQKSQFEEAGLRLKLAREKLALIETGHTEEADRQVDNVIKSTVNGTVLTLAVEEGDPVVPLTTYQAGTDLMTIAYMEDLIFKGNVDEIDVGKLYEGMPVEIEVGAIPNQKITGTLIKVSPKAHKEEGSTLFEVEIQIANIGDKPLRAGYSANANIIITKKDSVLVVPERLVKVADSVSTVEVKDSLGQIATRTIKTGLSDGINLEVTEGLKEGEKIVERPPKEIKATD